LFNLISFK